MSTKSPLVMTPIISAVIFTLLGGSYWFGVSSLVDPFVWLLSCGLIIFYGYPFVICVLNPLYKKIKSKVIFIILGVLIGTLGVTTGLFFFPDSHMKALLELNIISKKDYFFSLKKEITLSFIVAIIYCCTFTVISHITSRLKNGRLTAAFSGALG